MARGGGDNAINVKKNNFFKQRRRKVISYKVMNNTTAEDKVIKENLNIIPVEELVVEATQKRRETLLLRDIPNRELERKVKLVSGVRAGRMGKHGVMSLPTRINKKKVKKMLKRQNLKEKILKQVEQMDVEMRI